MTTPEKIAALRAIYAAVREWRKSRETNPCNHP